MFHSGSQSCERFRLAVHHDPDRTAVHSAKKSSNELASCTPRSHSDSTHMGGMFQFP